MSSAPASDLALFHRTLAEMCRSELPLPRALRMIEADLETSPLKNAVRAMADDVESGTSVADAYAAHATRFPPLYRALVEAGAEAGDLPGVLSGTALSAALSSARLLTFAEHTVAAVRAAEGTPRLASVLGAAAADDAEVENRRASVWAAAFYPLVVLALVGGIAGGIISPTRNRLSEVFDSIEISRPAALDVAARAGAVAGWVAIAAVFVLAGSWLVRRSPSLTGGLARLTRSAWQVLPFIRGASRLGAGARVLRALEPGVRAGMPLHEALRRAAPAAGCRASTKAALAAARLAEAAAPLDEVVGALLLPAIIRARLALAATRAPDALADAVRVLAEDCARRYHDALDTRMRWLQPAATLCVGAIVMTQLLSIFAILELVRRQVPTW